MKCAPRLPGCGTQHPHRALGGTRVLLAAAPTTPPCFRRWRRSSLLQRKNYFKFRGTETPAGVSVPFFHGWSRKGKRQLPRLFPAETVARRGAPSPSQSPLVTALPKGEPLAWRHSFRLNCKVCGFARASPFGRGGIASAMTERASPLPGSVFRPKFHVLGRKSQTIKQSAQKGGAKFGGGGLDRSRKNIFEKQQSKLKRIINIKCKFK